MATTSNVTKTGTTTGSPVAVPDTAAIARDAAQIRAQDRSRLAADKIANLDTIDKAQANIDGANKNIQINNQGIQAQRDSQAENLAAQQDAEAIIEQNNITLANPNLPSSSRAALEANNALNRAVIAESAVNIAQAEISINNLTVNTELQQESIQKNQAAIVGNADAFQARGGLVSDITLFEDGSQAVIFDQGDGVPEFSPNPVDPAEDPELPVEDTLDFGEEIIEPALVPPQNINPVAYDEDGNLMPGYELDEEGNPVFVGDFPTTTTFEPGSVPPQTINPVAYDDEGNLMPGYELDENGDPVFVGGEPTPTVYAPKSVPPSQAGPVGVAYDDDGNLMPGYTLDEEGNPVYVGGDFVEPSTQALADAGRAASQAATIAKAKQQATLQARYKQPGNNDWRVRLVLAEGADYLYKANPPGILKPLADSNGVIFPYTPEIQTTYSANYEQYDLVHSNYRGYFYKNSKVGDINLTANFTAQDTQEAQYLLAVIHFFRSVTKMFYGKDAQRGAPPPMVYLVGLGDFQFNGHPCLVSNFQYTMPSDVDYIRANNPNNYGTNMLNRVSKSATATSPTASVLNRLSNAIDNFGRSLQPGATSTTPAFGSVQGSINNTNRSTYVPTKMQISITLLPVQTRSQVSQQFSLKSFANGDLLKGGFW